MFLETNLGDPDHFAGTASLEEEVLEDIASLVHAPARGEARFLSGGTEANILALYAARERSGKRRVVLPESAHFSFEKAARMLDMELVWVATTPSGHADVQAMADALDDNTALMVGVAGTTELGLIDPIADLARVAKRARVPLHVDAAFGGYVIPFLEAAGRKPHVIDFRLPGVWSLSMDPHKMGMATIPAGILVMRNKTDWNRIAVKTPYVSTAKQASLAGTRPGAAAAATWAVHRHLGRKGFASVVETCLDNATFLAARLQELGVELVAEPELNVVTFRAKKPSALQAALQSHGFRVNVVPRMKAIRIVVNPHVSHQVLLEFLEALEECL